MLTPRCTVSLRKEGPLASRTRRLNLSERFAASFISSPTFPTLWHVAQADTHGAIRSDARGLDARHQDRHLRRIGCPAFRAYASVQSVRSRC